jgi:acyl-CoA thioesterase-1
LIDFVGSRKKHNDDTTEPDSYQFDPDHEGHCNKDSAWIAENMPPLLERNVPDVAVIHIGAEEFAANKAAAEPLTDGIIRNIERMIQALRSKNPNVKIVIAETLPVNGKEEVSSLLNRKIIQLARSSTSTRNPVVVAQTTREFDRIQDMGNDGNLPNPTGARKIAVNLEEAIRPMLGLEPGR